MRFLHFDRVTSFERGRSVRGSKSFSLAEPYLEHHFPRSPLVPAGLLLESMAQLVGWGIAQALDFRAMPIMSLVRGFSLADPWLRPGITAEIVGELVSIGERDSLGRAWLWLHGRELASVEQIIYSHIPAREPAELRRLCARVAGNRAIEDELCAGETHDD